jgi:hypothetical protein
VAWEKTLIADRLRRIHVADFHGTVTAEGAPSNLRSRMPSHSGLLVLSSGLVPGCVPYKM